jgi:hypothetical protein
VTYVRGVFSVLLVVTIVLGALAAMYAPPAEAGGPTIPQKKCKEGCPPYIDGNGVFCVYTGCSLSSGQCYYHCYFY